MACFLLMYIMGPNKKKFFTHLNGQKNKKDIIS